MKNLIIPCTKLLLIFIFPLFLLGCKSVELQTALIYYYQLNEPDTAIEYLQKAIKKNPAEIEAYILLGEIYGRKNLFSKMDSAFDSALVHISSSNPAHQNFSENINYLKDEFWCAAFNDGVGKLNENQLTAARHLFNDCITIDDQRPEAYINLGLIAENMKQLDSAVVYYEKSFELDSSHIDIMFYVAKLTNSKNQYEKTIQAMNKVLAVSPGNTDAMLEKAIAHDFLGDSEAAKSLYLELLQKNPEDTDIRFNLGRLYFTLGEYFDAIDLFNSVLEKNPDDLNTIILMGYSYFNLGEDIVIYLEEISGNDSTKISADESNAYKMQAKEYFENAIVYLEQALQKNSNDPDVLNMLAVAYENIGQKRKADSIHNKEQAIDKK